MRFSADGSLDGTGGFSLVEALTVLVLIGLLVAMAAPAIDVRPMRTEAAMQAVVSRLQAVQRTAVARQHDVVVSFEVPEGRIRVHLDADNDGVVDAGETVLVEPLGEGIVFGRGGAPAATAHHLGVEDVDFTRTQGRPSVVFHRGGSASEQGGFYLTSVRARDEGGRARDARALRVERATGQVTWFHFDGSAWRTGFR